MTTSKQPSLIGIRSNFESHFDIVKVLGQMTYLVADPTLDSARSCVMQGAFPTQGKASSIPTIFSWGGSIRPKGFLPSTLLLTNCALLPDPLASGLFWWLLPEFEIVKFIIHFLDLSWVYAFHQEEASLVRVRVANVTLFSSAQLLRENTDSVRVSLGPVFPLVLSAFAMFADCASRAVATLSATSCLMAA
ncbi:hypothetical protein Tco_0962621 [Tanacetum coccineum]